MVCKKPIAAAAVEGVPELIEHEKSGLLVEPENPAALAEALTRLLGDSELQRSVSVLLGQELRTRKLSRRC